MLAASEANHGALIDTVHAFVSQNVTSLPPTPRELNTVTNGNSSSSGAAIAAGATTPRGEAISDAAVESAKKLETMVSFWQEKLEAQVAESGNTLKLKKDFTMGGGNSSFSKVDQEEDEYNDASSTTSSDGETATPPTERKGESGLLPTSSSIGPVTPMQNVV